MQKHLAKTVLTTKRRASLPANAFVFPRERRFPIHDLYHGRLALIYVLSPSHAKSRDLVVEAVLSRYPQLQSFWREKSRALSTRSKSMRIIENPYGIDLPRGKKAGRIGMGEATHIIVKGANGPHALCRSAEAVDAVYPSKAGKITCYRCIKLNAINTKKGIVVRHMRPGDRSKRLKHMQIEGGREGEFIGRHVPRNQRALLYPGGGRQTAFGPHSVGQFDWGGLPVQKGQGPTQTRFSDRTDRVQKTPLDPKTAREFLKAIEARYTGAYARVANPAKGIRMARSSDAVRMMDLGPSAVRRYQVQFKDVVMTFPRKQDAEAAVATIEAAVQFGSKTMLNAALRAARQMAARNNPAAARRRASAGAGAQGGFSRGDLTSHPAYFAGYDAGRSAYESGNVGRRSRRGSYEESGVAMISFDEFAKRAAMHGKMPRSGEGAKAFKAGVEAVYYAVKPYVEQAYGDVPAPRLNGMKSIRNRIFAVIMALGMNPDRLSTTDMHVVAQQAHVSVQDVRKTLAA